MASVARKKELTGLWMAEDQGREAWFDGKPITSNPFKAPRAYFRWALGWDRADPMKLGPVFRKRLLARRKAVGLRTTRKRR